MSVSEEFLNNFRFSLLVVFMENSFISLEITLSFVMIASFVTRVILLKLDTFFTEISFYRLSKNFVVSYITDIYIVEILILLFSEKIHTRVFLSFFKSFYKIVTQIFMISFLIKVIF